MRVSESIHNAGAERFGVDPTSLRQLGAPPEGMYSCRKGSLSYAIRFLPVAEEGIPAFAEKLRYARYLADGGAEVAGPLDSTSGSLYEVLAEEDGLVLVFLIPHRAGQRPTARNLYFWNEQLFAAWGRAMGKMHALAQAYPNWQKGPDTRLMDLEEELVTFRAECDEARLRGQFPALLAALQSLPRDRASFGLIHNDLHPETFLYVPETQPDRPLLIQTYDHFVYGWFAADIGVALYSAITQGVRGGLEQREAFAQMYMKAFYKGYRLENQLDTEWFARLPLFLQIREMISYLALCGEWPADQRQRWQIKFLAEKRARLLRGEPVVADL